MGDTDANISDDEFSNDANAGGACTATLSDPYEYGGEEGMNQTYEAMKKSMYGTE